MSCKILHSGDKLALSDSTVTTLDKIHVGRDCNIVLLTMSSDFKQRFSEIGILFGAALTVAGKAPLGDPIMLKIDHTLICIRRSEAHRMYVSL